jgi:hypothetical protein
VKSTLREKFHHLWGETRNFREDAWKIVAIGMVFLFVYCGTDWKPQGSFVKWANGLPDGALKATMKPLAENLCLFPNAGEALMYQFKHNMRGHGVFLMGDYAPRAIWYYFPMTLAFKLSLPILLLTGLLLVLRPRELLSPVSILTVMLFLFTFNCRVQIGIRLILPLIAFLLVSASVGLVRAVPASWSSRWRESLFASVIFACLIPAATVWPHGLTYFNQLSGGSESGYTLLNDSNYDWGQGLIELQEWQAQHPEKPLRLWYFGMDPRAYREPFVLTRLHTLELKSPAEVEQLLRGSYLAVSTTILHGNPDVNEAWRHSLKLLKHQEPFARTRTFFIYSFEK